MLVLKIACLKLCFINLTRSECNCKTPLSTELTHGIPTIISFLCTSIISVLSALLLNKFPLKIVQAFASFTLWLSVMTSPDYLVVKCKIIFQKCSVPQNVQCLLQHPYGASTVHAQRGGFGVQIDVFWSLYIYVTSTIALIFMCLMPHRDKKGRAHSTIDLRISGIGKGETSQWISHLWVQFCHSWFKSGLVVATNTAGQGHSVKSLCLSQRTC